MNSVLLILFFSLAADCARFPISRNEYNIPSIEVDANNGSVNSTFRLDLKLHQASRLPSITETDGSNSFEFHLGDNLVAINARVRRSESTTSGTLGIGPSSSFLTRFQSAAMFANELVLNISQSEFAARCINESIVTIPIVYNGPAFNIQGFISFGTNNRGWIDLGITYPPLWLPSEAFDHLIHLLAASNVRWTRGEPNRLTNCNLDAINSLPDLRVNLENGQTILVSPSDFISLDPITNICIIHFGRVVGYGTSVIDPLALPGINVYISNDSSEIILCDDASIVH